jgi:hypothetical protein
MQNKCKHECITITDYYFEDFDGDYLKLDLGVQCEYCGRVNRTLKVVEVDAVEADECENEWEEE